MMLRKLTLITVLGLIGSPVSAANISVRDFATMTRISIPAGPNQKWTLKKANQAIQMSTKTNNLDLTAGALPKRGRLSQLEVWRGVDSAGINIAYRCNCLATSYMENSRTIVIDITERIEPASSVTASGHSEAQKEHGAHHTPSPATASHSSEGSWEPTRTLIASPIPQARPMKKTRDQRLDASVEALRESILEQITNAAENGRIELSEDSRSLKPAALKPGCPDEAELEFSRLTDTTSFRGPISGLRANVFDDMKQIDPKAVRALARHFIAFGLGTEARAVFKSFGVTGASDRLILDMATFLDREYDTLGNSALFQEGCGPRATVWRLALLAALRVRGVSEAYPLTDGTLFGLPDPLRKIIGARIALALLDEGDIGTAMRIWRNLENSEGPTTPEMRLFAAYLQAPGAPADAALMPLMQIAKSWTPEAIPAAFRATDILLQTRHPRQAEELLNIFDDLIFLHRESKLGADLALAKAKLNGHYGNLQSALTELQKQARNAPQKQGYLRSVIGETVRSAMETADPIARPDDFTTILRAQSMLDDSEASDAARFALARKLIDAGAAHLVPQILSPAMMRRSAEARRITAEAMLLNGDGKKALILLGEATDEASESLIARAKGMDAPTMRASIKQQFETIPLTENKTTLSSVRQLMEDADTDLSIVKELMSDG